MWWTRWTELVSQYSWPLQIEMLWGFCWSCWSVSLSRRGADTYVIVSALPSSSIRRQWVLVLSWAKMPCFVGILLAENLSCIIEVGLQKIGVTEWISGLKIPSNKSVRHIIFLQKCSWVPWNRIGVPATVRHVWDFYPEERLELLRTVERHAAALERYESQIWEQNWSRMVIQNWIQLQDVWSFVLSTMGWLAMEMERHATRVEYGMVLFPSRLAHVLISRS